MPADYTPPTPYDLTRRAHPEEIARSRAHASRERRTVHRCASADGAPCDCPPGLGDLADVWRGRARMAAARRAAGQPLDPTDHEALRRQELAT